MKESKSKAESEKVKGNEEMKKENYAEAINRYTSSIALDQNEPTTYCNRSLASMKLNQYDKAIADCTTAIELNKQYTKAYYRRGLCYGLLYKHDQAINDLLTAVNLSTESKEIIQEIKSLKDLLLNSIPDPSQKALKAKEIDDNLALALNKKYLPVGLSEKYKELIQSGVKDIQDIKAKITQKEYLQAEALIALAYKAHKEFNEELKSSYNCSEQHDYCLRISSTLTELKQLKESLKLKKESVNEKDRLNKALLVSKQVRENATKLAEEGMTFSDFSLTAYGFEKAFNSFKARLNVFFDFMCYFEAANFAKAFASTEVSVPLLTGIFEAFFQSTDLLEKHQDLFIGYCIALTQTKNFSLVKVLMKRKDKEFIKQTVSKIAQDNKEKEKECEIIISFFK